MKRKRRPGRAERVRHLLSLDASNVMHRLVAHETEMVSLFSRLRTREPLLITVRSWFETVTFGELAALEPGEQLAVNRFYELLGELRWYLQYTEDMPGKVQRATSQRIVALDVAHRALLRTLGPPSGEAGRVVDAKKG